MSVTEGETMTAHVLVSGVLLRARKQRMSKSGKPFVRATIRAEDGEAML
jgi:hypothetical protein